jgi:phage shock protein C
VIGGIGGSQIGTIYLPVLRRWHRRIDSQSRQGAIAVPREPENVLIPVQLAPMRTDMKGTFVLKLRTPLVRGGRAMYCNYCGKVIQDDAAVCAYCGIRVGASVARKRLVRPRQGRKIAGVCLGFAEYFDIDVTAIRLVWLIASFMTGIGVISYPIAWIIMPEEPLLLMAPAGAEPVTNS